MNKLKVGAVVYAPRVTVIWGIIADFFKGEGFEIEPIYYKDYRSQVDGLIKEEIDVAWIILPLYFLIYTKERFRWAKSNGVSRTSSTS